MIESLNKSTHPNIKARDFARFLVEEGYMNMSAIPYIEWCSKLAGLVLKEKGAEWMEEGITEAPNFSRIAERLNVFMIARDGFVEDQRLAASDLLGEMIDGAIDTCKNACNLLLESVAMEIREMEIYEGTRKRFDPEQEYGVRAQGEI